MKVPELEECRTGGLTATVEFERAAAAVRSNESLDVDTEQMLLWHRDDVKCSLVKSSGTLTVRTEDHDEARRLLRHALQEG